MRIVSLLPSTTEILFALGAGDDVVGVTFECDTPPAARTRTIVSTSAMPEGLDAAGIDAWVSQALRSGEDLYRLDADALRALDADLVVTQDLCAVCAVDVDTVDEALAHLGCTAAVMTVDPHTLDDVLGSVTTLGAATGHDEAARALFAGLRTRFVDVAPAGSGVPAPPPPRAPVRGGGPPRGPAPGPPAAAGPRAPGLRTRLLDVATAVSGLPAPRTVLLEWTDPPFAPGHWVPEMVERAGGLPVLGRAGQKSVRTTWEAVADARPEVVVCAPCGYDLDGATRQAIALVERDVLPSGVPVWAVDADAAYARPGPRLADGVETLAAILHPEVMGPPKEARRVR